MMRNTNRMNSGKGGFHYLVALLFIIVGLLFLGKNLGLISAGLFGIVVSWPMLLIVMGLWFLFRRDFGGIFLLLVGTFFFIPKITAEGSAWVHTYWPVFLVFIGIVMLFGRKRGRFCCPKQKKNKDKFSDVNCQSGEGFLDVKEVFGMTRYIMFDPVFKGASIKNVFSGTILDFRHTTLEAPETVMEVDCVFSGIEMYVPDNWAVVLESKSVLGGCEDKRRLSGDIDHAHKLIIRGNLVFSGIEIKN